MKKNVNQAPQTIKRVRLALLATLSLLTLPLFLEFLVLGPLILTHSIYGQAYILLSKVIAGTAIIASLVGIVVSILSLIKWKHLAANKQLSLWVIVLTGVYIILGVILFLTFSSFQSSLK